MIQKLKAILGFYLLAVLLFGAFIGIMWALNFYSVEEAQEFAAKSITILSIVAALALGTSLVINIFKKN